MNKRLILWISGIVGMLAIGMGVYMYAYAGAFHEKDTAQQPFQREFSEKRGEKVDLGKQTPISILMLGKGQRPHDGNSFVLLTVNPHAKSTKMVSVPGDTYMETVGKGKRDTLDHAYALGGIGASVRTMENFLNVPIDYYIEMDTAGFRDIVNAVGGLDVTNNADFTQSGVHFAKGPVHISGETVLAYTCMKEGAVSSDANCQSRQRQVMQAAMQKSTNMKKIEDMGTLLGAAMEHVKTNLTLEDMLQMKQGYAAAQSKTEEVQIDGSTKTAKDGSRYYEVSEQTRQQLSRGLREHLELEQ